MAASGVAHTPVFSQQNEATRHEQGRQWTAIGFKEGVTEWGQTNDRTHYTSVDIEASDGAQMTDVNYTYRSGSKFKQAVKRMLNGRGEVIERSAVLDGRGRESGIRVVIIVKEGGVAEDVWLCITWTEKRNVRGVRGPSLEHIREYEKAKMSSLSR